MSSHIQSLAKELTDALNLELSRQDSTPAAGPTSAELFDLLISLLAERVALELQSRQNGNGSAGAEALLHLARRARTPAQSSRDQDQEGQTESSALAGSRLDIREKSPKYANIESLLRYDDAHEPGAGVKLVIMNFND